MSHTFFAKGDPDQPPWCGFIPMFTTRQCGLPEDHPVHRGKIVAIARCTGFREDVEEPCTGRLFFRDADPQAKCDTCGGWTGVMVADYTMVHLGKLYAGGRNLSTQGICGREGLTAGDSEDVTCIHCVNMLTSLEAAADAENEANADDRETERRNLEIHDELLTPVQNQSEED